MLNRFVSRAFSLAELTQDRGLRLYGACVALIPGLGALFYATRGDAVLLSRETAAACWPFFEACEPYRFTSTSLALGALYAVALASFAASGCFLAASKRSGPGVPRLVRTAWWLLLVAWAAKLALHGLDLRLRHNQALIELYTLFAFLFLPSRRSTLKLLIALIYVAAGALKFDPSWLSGHVLKGGLWIRPEWGDGFFLRAACAYVIALELGLVWGVYSKHRAVFLATLAQLGLFHLFSLPIVGPYYPTLMALLLSLYWIDRAIPPPTPPARALDRAPGWAWIAVFAGLQLLPKTFTGDPALTGEGRSYALYMFLPETDCGSRLASEESDDASLEITSAPQMRGNYRDRCDPLLHRALALSRCRERPATGQPPRLTWHFRSVRTMEPGEPLEILWPGFCEQPPAYRFFSANPWIPRLQ